MMSSEHLVCCIRYDQSFPLCLCTVHDPSYALFLLGVILDIFDDSCIPSTPLLSVPPSARVILSYGNLLLVLDTCCVIHEGS